MNAERLHAIAAALRDEMAQTEYPQYLNQLVEGLQATVESPNQPGPQEQVSEARQRLISALTDAPSNDASPAERQALEEMGIADLLGEALAERVELILSAHEITPSAAANELGEIRERVQRLQAVLDQSVDALTFLQIGTEELSPGEFEIGFMIPRVAVDNGLKSLGEEFIDLKKIIAPFGELANEGRTEIPVRSISSSEFQVFLHSTPGAAVLFAAALERILKAYQTILDIRLKHRELSEDASVPEDALKPLADHASERMETEIRAVADQTIDKAALEDEDRLNELRTEVTGQLRALAERIDRGFDVEVRAGELPESVEGEADEDGLDKATREATEFVLDAQKDLEFMNVSGKPILSLEQADDEAEEVADDADADEDEANG